MPPRTKKIKTTQVRDGHEVVVEVEVPDIPAAWPPPGQRRVTGKRIPRVEARAKVTGKAVYSADVQLPGLLYGKILRSPHPHARVTAVDVEAARRMRGVRAVVILAPAGTELTYAGQEVVALAATDERAAEDALRAIRVTYEPLEFAVDEEAAAPARQGAEFRERGDVDAAFARSDIVTIEGTYHAPVVVHVCLETHGLVAHWERPDRLKVWASTQGIHSVREGLAGALGIPASQIEVICEHMGGGFGSKFSPGPEGVTAARLAREARAPVRLMLDRHEEFTAQGSRPSITATLKLGASRDGRLVALHMDGLSTGGVGEAGGFHHLMPYVYECPNVRARCAGVPTNAAPATAMRAPDHPGACFVMESAMDELAYQLGMDPLEFRKRNDPNPVRQREYDLGARRIGWERRNRTPGQGTGPKRRGMGVASCLWGGGGGPGSVGNVTIHRDGRVDVSCGTQDIGTGTRTAMAIVAAEDLGLQPADINVGIGHTAMGPGAPSGGSITLASVTPAIKTGCVEARLQLFAAVAPALKAKPEELEVGGGRVFVKSDPRRGLTWKQACAKLPPRGVTARGQWASDLQASGVAGCQFAEVEVDVETGQVRVLRVVAVHDCGIVVDTLTAETQIQGGVIMGLGYALLEERVWDVPHGLILNGNLEDYKCPGSMEMPVIEAILLDRPEATWVSGLGEPPTIPTAPAVANAIYNAAGVRIRSLPITRAKVLEALEAQRRNRP